MNSDWLCTKILCLAKSKYATGLSCLLVMDNIVSTCCVVVCVYNQAEREIIATNDTVVTWMMMRGRNIMMMSERYRKIKMRGDDRW